MKIISNFCASCPSVQHSPQGVRKALTTTTATMTTSPAMEKLYSMVATSALYNGKRNDDYTGECHEGTREKYLGDLTDWADNGPSKQRVQWVRAVAGAGKTAMLRTFCTKLKPKASITSASFFVWKNDPSRNNLDQFPATIASQLCRSIPALVSHVEMAIHNDPFLLKFTFEEQMEQLVIVPLLNIVDVVKENRHIIIVIDGVDELDTKGQQDLLKFIPLLLSKLSSLPISILVSSRPEPQIVGAFNRSNLNSITFRITLEESPADILHFIVAKFKEINDAFPYLAKRYGQWPNDNIIAIMCNMSSGFFIWPAVAMGYIAATGQGMRHNERLELVLSSSSVEPWKENIDKLYRAILMAHTPRNPAELDRFKRRLALLCLPVQAGKFVHQPYKTIVDASNVLIHAVFEDTLDGVWDSMDDLASLFSPRAPPSPNQSPLPALSHRSFRDFAFNRNRSGDDLYYRSEEELNAEVVCKFFEFFNSGRAYECAGLPVGGWLIYKASGFVKSHLDAATGTDELGRCIDDISLDSIPKAWPLVSQAYLIGQLFASIYSLPSNIDLPEWPRRQEALLFKTKAFFHKRSQFSQSWDLSLYQLLAFRLVTQWGGAWTIHSVYCWHISQSAQCQCVRRAEVGYTDMSMCNSFFASSTLVQDVLVGQVSKQGGITELSLDILQFMLSLVKTPERAVELSAVIPTRLDTWIRELLAFCPPNKDLYNALGPICTAPLPDLPVRDEDGAGELVGTLLEQTKAFNEYTARCREAGIETTFQPAKIPASWWQGKGKRELIKYGYEAPSPIASTTIESTSRQLKSRLNEDVEYTSDESDEYQPSPAAVGTTTFAITSTQTTKSKPTSSTQGPLTPALLSTTPKPLADHPLTTNHPPALTGTDSSPSPAISPAHPAVPSNAGAGRQRRGFLGFLKTLGCL